VPKSNSSQRSNAAENHFHTAQVEPSLVFGFAISDNGNAEPRQSWPHAPLSASSNRLLCRRLQQDRSLGCTVEHAKLRSPTHIVHDCVITGSIPTTFSGAISRSSSSRTKPEGSVTKSAMVSVLSQSEARFSIMVPRLVNCVLQP
jgi:hypothetical protein